MKKKTITTKNQSNTTSNVILFLALCLSFISIFTVIRLQTELDQISVAYQVSMTQLGHAQECIQKEQK